MPEGGTVFLKCALDESGGHGAVSATKSNSGKVSTQSLSCGASCEPEQENKVDKNSTGAILGMAGESGSHAIDYNRYCFYNCRPYDFNVGNICVKMSKEVLNKTKGEIDPAAQPHVTDPNVQGAWAVATGAAKPSTPPPPVTTSSLPCEASDPCAYKMMNASIKEAKMYYGQAASASHQATKIANAAGSKVKKAHGL